MSIEFDSDIDTDHFNFLGNSICVGASLRLNLTVPTIGHYQHRQFSTLLISKSFNKKITV